jgi:phosphate:Na+ symporter
MSVIAIVLDVIGGLGIFLLGMKNMSEGLQAVAGSRLRQMIGAVTDNRIMAVAVGTVVTCLVQSSSITTVMVVGLVNSGFMTLMQALGVIFGANIGTTITGWLISLLPKVGKYGLPLLGISAFFFLFSKKERVRYIGMFIMGLGMIFFGLELMSSGLKPIRGMPEFVQWFQAFQAHSYGGVLKCALVGCVLTMIVQSSSATLGITMNLALNGVIGFETAAALVLGENIGTTITAYLASLGASTNAKRAAYGHIFFNLIGVLWITAIFLPFYLPLIKHIVGEGILQPELLGGEETFPHMLPAIALVHSGFNIVNTIMFLPFMGLLARLVTRLAPGGEVEEIPRLTYLDVRMLDTPDIGIAQSKKEIDFMGDSIDKMMGLLRVTLESDSAAPDQEQKLLHREEILDNVQKEITEFLGQLLSGRITHDAMDEARKQMRMADEYESISDYIVKVLKLLRKLRKNELAISDEGRAQLLELHDRTAAYLDMITKWVKANKEAVLSKAYTQGNEVTRLMKRCRRQHLARVQEGQVPPVKTLVYTDLLNAYRRIRDHAVNIAEALAGEK